MLTFLSPDTIQAILIFWLLLLLRMVNGITGKKLTLIDVFSTLGFTIFLSFTRENSLYLLLFVLAIISLITIGKRSKAVLISGSLASVLFIGQTVLMNRPSFISLNELDYVTGSLLALTLLSVLLFWRLSKVTAFDDKGEEVDSSRIFSSQLIYCITVILFTLSGSLTINDQIIYLAVVSGIIFYHLRVTLFTSN